MRSLVVLCTLSLSAACAQTTREMNDINWMEFHELVPKQIQTVLLPTGVLEPHGVMNNGADNTTAVALARAMAPRLNAMVAPVLSYGITGILNDYPGAFTLEEDTYRKLVMEILAGLARQGFRNIIVVNAHGGPQSAILNELADKAGRAYRVRILVTHWWTYCADITQRMFNEAGDHAGNSETAMVQAIDPKLVHPERYSESMASALPSGGSWAAYPFPSSILLYRAGQGYPKFDQIQAGAFFKAVVDKMTALAKDTITKWDAAHIFEDAAH
jgi:creatinine amidohydrolase